MNNSKNIAKMLSAASIDPKLEIRIEAIAEDVKRKRDSHPAGTPDKKYYRGLSKKLDGLRTELQKGA